MLIPVPIQQTARPGSGVLHRKRVTHHEDSHMTDSTPKKVKDESLAVHTMSRRQYYDEVLCVIENAQSTTIDDDFPQFVLQ